MKWTREEMEALADKFAQVFVETVEKSGGKATIVKDEGSPTLREAASETCPNCGGVGLEPPELDLQETCVVCKGSGHV